MSIEDKYVTASLLILALFMLGLLIIGPDKVSSFILTAAGVPTQEPVVQRTPVPEKYETFKVIKLYDEKITGNNGTRYWIVSDKPKSYQAYIGTWLILEVGKCYQFHFYNHSETYIDGAWEKPCE